MKFWSILLCTMVTLGLSQKVFALQKCKTPWGCVIKSLQFKSNHNSQYQHYNARARYHSRFHESRRYQVPQQEAYIEDEDGFAQVSYSNRSYRKVSGVRKFVFDPRRLRWYAYIGGRLIKSGQASGGKGYCPDIRRSCRTPVGRFRFYAKRGANCKSSIYPVGRGGAPMPYCMFFRGGYAIHGSPHVPNWNASHGCIRVPPSDARWLHQNFMKIGTTVVVRPY